MKALLFTIAILSSLSALATVSECDTRTTLTCKATYYSLTAENRIAKTELVRSGQFELINWDEPSLAYCEASVGFTENDLYVAAALSADSGELNLRLMRSSTGGRSQDQFSSTAVVKPGALVKGSLSLSTAGEGVYAVEVECQAHE